MDSATALEMEERGFDGLETWVPSLDGQTGSSSVLISYDGEGKAAYAW